MKQISSYRIMRSIYIEGLGEFRKGSTAHLSEDEAMQFPQRAIQKLSDYLQGFDDKPDNGMSWKGQLDNDTEPAPESYSQYIVEDSEVEDEHEPTPEAPKPKNSRRKKLVTVERSGDSD